MELTQFLPVFLLFAAYSCASPQHWVSATAVACFFQGASPFLIAGEGRMIGFAPAYALLPIGIMHYATVAMRPRPLDMPSRRLSLAHLWLLGFTAVAISGAFLLPRIFAGFAHAMPTRIGLDAGAFYSISPSATNVIQAIYVALNFILFAVICRFVTDGMAMTEDIVAALSIGVLISALFGIYQVIAHFAGLPWPTDFINSNTGVGQFPTQMAGPMKRISATFWEPSLLSYHFVGMVGLLLFGSLRRGIGILVLAVLMMSTSSVGYFSLPLLLALWLLLDHGDAKRRTVVFMLTCAVTAVFVTVDMLVFDGRIVGEMILNKSASTSGVSRNNANLLAFRTFVESWGFGVGVGTARASSLIATLLATTGWPGLLTFGGFTAAVLSSCFGQDDSLSRALGYGLCGLLIVWIISIPDIVQAIFWLLAATAVGRSSKCKSATLVLKPTLFRPHA